MASVPYCTRRIFSAISSTCFTASAIKTTSVLQSNQNDGHRENRRGLVLLRKEPRRVIPEISTTATQLQQRRNSSSSSKSPSMTAEAAGRKASKLASEAMKRKNRLQQLLRAVDHVVDDDDDNCDNDDSSGNKSISMATLLSHAGIEVYREGTSCSSSNGAGFRENVPMSPPLHTATTYTRPADGIYKDGYVL